MPSFYPEGDTVLPSDNELRSLHKIASQGGGGGAGGGGLSGAGAPGAGLGSDGDLYFDTTNIDLYGKVSGAWQLLVDIV